MEFIPLLLEHYEQVNAIYMDGLATGQASFQKEGKSWEEWDRGHLQQCRLVAVSDGIVLGWAALSPVSSRPVYAGVAESSVYIAEAARGKGIGLALMQRLVEESEAAGIWTLQVSIFPENKSSVGLHQKVGFRIQGYRERIGRMKSGEWRDTVLMERRSAVVGNF